MRQSLPEVPPGLEQLLAKMMTRKPEDRYQTPGQGAKALELERDSWWGQTQEDRTPGQVAKALEPHTERERQARSGATRKLPAVAKAPVRTFTPSETELALALPGGELNPRRRVMSPLLLALAGAVALLGVLVGVIALVANNDAGDSRKGPASLAGTPAVTTRSRPFLTRSPFRPRAPWAKSVAFSATRRR